MKKTMYIVLTVLAIMCLMSGCGSTSTKNNENIIYTSIYPLQFITEKIVGDTATVLSVYPPGVDAHTFEPTSRSITEIATGKAFIYLGAGMEGFSESTANALQSTHVAFIEIGSHEALFLTADDDHGHDHHHDHGDFDPHIWFDPLRMIDMAELITKQLIELSPNNESLYNDNFNLLQAQLLQLDQEFNETLQMKTNTNIIVSHAAYGYWEARYGIKQIPIRGLSSSGEPSQKDLVDIIESANTHKLEYVLFEQNTSDRIAKIIQEHINADILYIHNLEVLTEQDIKNGEDYFSIMRNNLKTLDQATY